MNIKKICFVLCGLLFAVQPICAQQNMFVVDDYGEVDAIGTSTINYATFNIDEKWFTLTNDSIEATSDNFITASCSLSLSPDGVVKSFATKPEVGVCYSAENSTPTIDDNCLSLGKSLKSYTFSLTDLAAGTTYYFRPYVKIASAVVYGEVESAKTLESKLADNSRIINGHLFIDLGLPSGLLWAETNIGAETALDAGDYFAWGETQTKTEYSWDNYKYGDLSKYNSIDGKTCLDPEDDAAYVNWGSACRMPSLDEFNELFRSGTCSSELVDVTNSSGETVSAYKLVSKRNGNTLFLPAAGIFYGDEILDQGDFGSYWSSTVFSNNINFASYLGISFFYYSTGYYLRYYGFSVRAVAEP